MEHKQRKNTAGASISAAEKLPLLFAFWTFCEKVIFSGS